MRNDILTALGLGTLATVLVGGLVVAVSIVSSKNKRKTDDVDMRENHQPIVSEKVQYLGWEEIDEDTYKKEAEGENNKYEPCYASLYLDGYLELDFPNRVSEDGGEEFIIIEPGKIETQSYIPIEYVYNGGYFINHKTKQAWSIMSFNFEFLGEWANRGEVIVQ